MNKTLTLITLATLFAATAVTAAEPTGGSIKPAAPTTVAATDARAPQKNGAVSQQDKMRLCSQQATGKKGQERKTFMKGCLSKKAGA